MYSFFTADSLIFFRTRLSNKRQYRSGDAQDEADGTKIKAEIFAPSNTWAHQVAQRLPAYQVGEDNKWQNAGSFKEYSWTRIFLRELGDQYIYFRVGVDGRGGYITYNIDCYWDKLQPAEETRLRDAIATSGPEEQSIHPEAFPNYNWERLIEETVSFIQKNEQFFRYLHTLLDANMEAAQKAKVKAAAALAAKFPNPNIILYGPPGTGKTYRTLSLAYELLIGTPPAIYDDAQKLFQEELGKRIEFVTFHQNFTYEDFVQGIKPDVDEAEQLVFKRRNGVFYEIARRAREEYRRAHSAPNSSSQVSFEDAFNRLLEPLIEQRESAIQMSMKETNYSFPITDMGNGFITFKRGQNGKSINVQNSYLQSLYEDTIAIANPTGTQIYYLYIIKRLREVAQEIASEAEATNKVQNANQAAGIPQNYVLIIDEINRANISKVFGELITLLEKDKRLGGDTPLSVTLPSGEAKFNVPANLYLIGTMNTADKSIAMLDIALRRRFEFQAIYPIYQQGDYRFTHADVFEELNKAIKNLKSRDFQIGHAYFMNLAGQQAEPLGQILDKKVIPLLYEYFLNDDNKVRQVFEQTSIKVHEDSATGLLRYNPAG